MFSQSGTFIAVLLVGFGVYLLMGKGAKYVAGYSGKTEEERARVDEKKVSRYFGVVVLSAAGITLLGDVFFALGHGLLGVLSSVVWVGVLVIFVVWANSESGRRFFAKKED